MPDFDAFRNRLTRNARHWSRWARRQNIACYRIYDRDIPQFPLAIDRYGAHVHLQEIDTGWQLTDDEYAGWVAAVQELASQCLEVPAGQVHYKRRERQRGAAQYQRLPATGVEFPVEEGGLRFLVDLDTHLDTGLFLDHRKTRGLVRSLAAGRRFLNLFAYTGSFSVYAAAGGAASTETVDLSNTYLDWAGRNLRLNGFDAGRHRLVRADVFAYLDGAVRERRAFDMIVLDPPSFSNSKRMQDVLDVQRDHTRLVGSCMDLLAPGGELVFSTNRRHFELDPALVARYACDDIHAWSVPEDFRNRSMHRCWRLTRRT